MALVDIAAGVSTSNVDALVVSACVQMPSLEAIPGVEARAGVPVVSSRCLPRRFGCWRHWDCRPCPQRWRLAFLAVRQRGRRRHAKGGLDGET